MRPVLGLALMMLALAGTPARAQDTPAPQAEPSLVERGAYLARAANCAGCHTAAGPDAAALAGGRPLKTPFGTLWAPNITSDPGNGIGRWSEGDFARAMREGRAPDGSNYYPAFPYPSYTQMTDADLQALWAWLRTVAPAARANRPQELRFPFNIRLLLTPWKWLFFRERRFEPEPSLAGPVNRGAYLVAALGHCGECHTERNILGATRESRAFAGSLTNAEGDAVPNITPSPDGLADWAETDIAWYLETGTSPDYEPAGGLMAQVVQGSTKYLTGEDRRAIAAYLKSVPPLPGPKRSG